MVTWSEITHECIDRELDLVALTKTRLRGKREKDVVNITFHEKEEKNREETGRSSTSYKIWVKCNRNKSWEAVKSRMTCLP